MKKEQKVISLPLARELQKVAKKNGFELPESEYSWIIDNEREETALIKSEKPFNGFECEKYSYFRAFDTSELGEIFSKINAIFNCKIKSETEGTKHFCDYYKEDKEIKKYARTEASCRGKLLVYLISNKLI